MSQQPPPPAPGSPEPTQPLPPAGPAPQGPAQPPPAYQASQAGPAHQPPPPAGPAYQGTPQGGPAYQGPPQGGPAYQGPPQGGPAYQGPPQGPPGQLAPVGFGQRPPGMWQRATSTSGRRWALAGAAVALVILLATLAVGGLLVARTVAFGGGRHGFMLGRDERDSRVLPGPGQGNGQLRRHMGPGAPGGRLPGIPGAGAAHGEYTVQGRTLVFQSGQVTAVSGSSITLRSSDGFTGTYKVTNQTRVRGVPVGAISNGDTALVVAAKDTSEATLVATARAAGQGPGGTS